MFGFSIVKSGQVKNDIIELEKIASEIEVRSKMNKLSNDRLMGSDQDNQLQRAIFKYIMRNQVVYYNHDNNTFIEKGYGFNPHVYTVINFIARNKSQAKFFLSEIKNKKEHYEYLSFKNEGNVARANTYRRKALEVVEDGMFANMMKHPNKNQGWSEYMFSKSGYHELMGNSYVYGQNPAGIDNLFSQIFVAPSPLMEIVSGGWMEPVKGYKVNFGYDIYSDIEAEKVLHQKMWNPVSVNMNQADYLYGLSPLRAMLRTMKRSNESVDASLAYLVNGAPAGVLSNESERPMPEEGRKAAQEALNNEFGGGANVNKILQSSFKVSWQQIGLSPVDLELLESDKVDLGTFCRGYGIDVIIFDPDKSAYNNKLTAEKAAWQNTIIPKLNEEREGLNGWLTPGWSEYDGKDYYIDYDISHIACLQADLKELASRIYEGVKLGIYSPNEAAELLGQEIDPNNADMNKRYMDSNLKTLGDNRNEILEILSSVSPLVANKLIESLTPEQLQSIFSSNGK